MLITDEQKKGLRTGKYDVAEVFLQYFMNVDDTGFRAGEIRDAYPTEDSLRAYADHIGIPLYEGIDPWFELAAKIKELRNK